jgi:hypothetical protein
VILEHHRPFRPRGVDLVAIQHAAAARGLQQARDNIEYGGFTATGMADQRHELAFANFQVDVFQRYKWSVLCVKGHLYIG